MALLKVDFYSDNLKKFTTVHIVLPNDVQESARSENPAYDRTMKILYLLHGFSGYSMDWLMGCNLQSLSVKYNLAIILPSGDNSFYVDRMATGGAYGSFVGEELPAYLQKTFRFSCRKEDVYIGGLSMGGFGAIRLAFRYEESYRKVFGLSSAVILKEIQGMQPGEENAVANYEYYRAIFGDLNNLENSEANPMYLLDKLKKEGKPVPPVYMVCGTEDFLMKNNREFVSELREKGVSVEYKESKGTHDWEFWNENLEAAIQWMLE